MDTLNNLPKQMDSGKAFPVRILNTGAGKTLYTKPATAHKIPAYKSERFKVEAVSIFLACSPLVRGNITMLIAAGRNKKIFPTIWAREYRPESAGVKKYFTKTISKFTRFIKQKALIATGNMYI